MFVRKLNLKNIENFISARILFRKYVTNPNSTKSNFDLTKKLFFANETCSQKIPMYSVLDNKLENESMKTLKVSEDTLVKMYKTMVSLNVMDSILYESQRQGRISFYMTNFGEEAVQIGSAAALSPKDLIYAQYRESGVLLWRGFSFQDFINQCYGNENDRNKGRQMPVHYGSKELNFVTISSPLTTQLPQAVGAAYGIKYNKENSCIACYFGEGAASEGDAHAALNFAATLSCPVIFICRNNGYAISTPSHQQYNGDGIAAKGIAYGINTLRVDGNDVIAMYQATEFARDYAVKNKKPVLIEAMTYRIGHHSTSDDSRAYRSSQELDAYLNETPISRLKSYLENCHLWDEEKNKTLIAQNKSQIIEAMQVAEKCTRLNWTELFSDVYHKIPKHIFKQQKIMEAQILKYPKIYSS